MISLIGMPGGGKSTVGRQLARRLDRRFIDCDAQIEQRLGMPIRAFFEAEGEDRFRDIEQETIADLLSQPSLVLATGPRFQSHRATGQPLSLIHI